ncbi:hypothetical protein P2G88_08415 [Aliiglaciecola sp. CAU 1673]|uniref:hypothetical protein n=1 Tax=Aliiglaciecola sp. CAU 1673 TaxID=3032595 RepID=UPI0023DA0F31|nr:hypothetical protein [Aliiglaciecola sp. CAU 1673]MDF2178272.1 hypothetical protein [Aliiglaciecola sp. CAU 1673]
MPALVKNAIFLLSLFTLPVNASLIQWDAFNQGDNFAVKDESTGIVWLDTFLTLDMSYNHAIKAFAGWRAATQGEVHSLLNTAFGKVNHVGKYGSEYNFEQGCLSHTSCYKNAKSWQRLFGAAAGNRYYQTFSRGFYQDKAGQLRAGGSYINGSYSANVYSTEYSSDYSRFFNNGNQLIGTFLVKAEEPKQLNLSFAPKSLQSQSVNEPFSLALLLLPLLWILRAHR